MREPGSIQEFLKRIKPYQKGVYLVGLFGSYARGDYKPDSDIDLLVVLKDQKLRDKLLEAADRAMEAVDYEELLSPVVMNLKHYRKIKALNSDFYYFLEKEGKILWRSKV